MWKCEDQMQPAKLYLGLCTKEMSQVSCYSESGEKEDEQPCQEEGV